MFRNRSKVYIVEGQTELGVGRWTTTLAGVDSTARPKERKLKYGASYAEKEIIISSTTNIAKTQAIIIETRIKGYISPKGNMVEHESTWMLVMTHCALSLITWG